MATPFFALLETFFPDRDGNVVNELHTHAGVFSVGDVGDNLTGMHPAHLRLLEEAVEGRVPKREPAELRLHLLEGARPALLDFELVPLRALRVPSAFRHAANAFRNVCARCAAQLQSPPEADSPAEAPTSAQSWRSLLHAHGLNEGISAALAPRPSALFCTGPRCARSAPRRSTRSR